jgi:hypothetical protein
MYVFSAKPEVDPLALLAILQSRFFLFLYRISNLGEARVIPQIKAAKLGPLPIPAIPWAGSVSERLRISALQMLDLNKRLQAVKTPQEKISLERQISATDAQIDKLAYELYGLTEGEMRIVEGKAATPEAVAALDAEEPKKDAFAASPESSSDPRLNPEQAYGDAAHYYSAKEEPPPYKAN